MNILKSIMGYKPVPLARLSDRKEVQTMSGLNAYICLSCATRTISESAPHGTCSRCNSASILPILSYVDTALRLYIKLEVAAEKTRAQEKKEGGGPINTVKEVKIVVFGLCILAFLMAVIIVWLAP